MCLRLVFRFSFWFFHLHPATTKGLGWDMRLDSALDWVMWGCRTGWRVSQLTGTQAAVGLSEGWGRRLCLGQQARPGSQGQAALKLESGMQTRLRCMAEMGTAADSSFSLKGATGSESDQEHRNLGKGSSPWRKFKSKYNRERKLRPGAQTSELS